MHQNNQNIESFEEYRLTRKEKRLMRRNGNNKSIVQEKPSFNMKNIEPLTDNQRLSFDAYQNGRNLMLHGIAGTGKSFISVYLALNEILSGNSRYKKLVIIRSVVPTRDMGFLPGSPKEKALVYEAPYYNICSELFGRGDAYDVLKNKKTIEFISTSFIRGITLNDCIIVVDEIANMTLHELDSIITRVGRNCRIIFSGDFRQSDFIKDNDKAGLLNFIKIIERMKSFTFIDFQECDIVRSGLVREYIITKDRLNITT
jgi:phosphate starvation-inducible protein PhoH